MEELTKPKAISLLMGFVLLVSASYAAGQDLADMARAEKEKKNKEEKKPAKVYTNEDFSGGKSKSGKSTDAPPTSTAPDSPSTPTPSNHIFTVEDRSGRKMQVAPDAKTDLIFMATWCQYSKQLKEMLNDPRSHPYWADRKLIFLFSTTEWSRAKSQLDKMATKGEIAEADIPAKLEEFKREAGSPYVMDPSFLDGLPGEAYFCPVPDKVSNVGFPRILSAQGYCNRAEWLVHERNMPVDDYKKVSGDHDPDKDESSN